MLGSSVGCLEATTAGDTRLVNEVATATITGRPSSRKRTVALCLPIAALSAASVTGDVLAPSLLRHHVAALVLLTPRTAYLAAAAPHIPLPLFMIIGLARLAVGDPFHFLLGRLHGQKTVDRLGRFSPRMASTARRAGIPAVAAFPTGKTLLAAGAGGLAATPVAVADLAGTAVRIVAVWAAARSLPAGAALILRASWVTPVAVVAGTVAFVCQARWRTSRGGAQGRSVTP